VSTLVIEFVRKHFPRTRFESDSRSRFTYSIWPDEQLRGEIRRFNYRPGDKVPLCLLSGDGATVTFDINVAKEHSRIEYIHVHHPLVRLIVDHYGHIQSEFSPTAAIEVVSTEVAPGIYAYTVHKLTMEGIRHDIRLIPVFVDVETRQALSPDSSEKLFAKLIASARDVPARMLARDTAPLVAAYRDSVREFSARSDRIIQMARDRDSAFRARRSASVGAYFEKRINRQRELSREHSWKGSKDSVIKGFETRAENLHQEMVTMLQAIETGDVFDPSPEELIGGVVIVKTKS